MKKLTVLEAKIVKDLRREYDLNLIEEKDFYVLNQDLRSIGLRARDLTELGFEHVRFGKKMRWVLKNEVIKQKAKDENWRLRMELKSLKSVLKIKTENLEKALDLLEIYRGVEQPLPEFEVPEIIKKKSEKSDVPVLLLSDIHYDEVVDEREAGNTFNRKIAERRIFEVVESTIEILKKYRTSSYSGFVLALLGDLVSGNIHDELREANETTVIEAARDIASVLVEVIKRLKEEFGRVFVPCVVGNHGRIDRKPRAKKGAIDNFDHLVYMLLDFSFKDDKDVQLLIPRGFEARFQIHGERFVAVHGDRIRAGRAIGGLTASLSTSVTKMQAERVKSGRPFDVLLMGHYHSTAYGPNFFANGSIKGADEYSVKEGFMVEPPQQTLFVVNPKYGIHSIYRIIAEEPGETKEKVLVWEK